MKISVVVPTYNEASRIGQLVKYLFDHSSGLVEEVIVVDGGSRDHTLESASREGAIALESPERGRGVQMNYAVQKARSEILYFVHADTIPPTSYASDVLRAVQEGYPIGCYRFRFDSPQWMLKINAYFTRFDRMFCRGGDQTLFVTREVFHAFGGYNPQLKIMEEYDLIGRVRKRHSFRIMSGEVLVSARKYEDNGYFRVNFANLVVFMMFRFGYTQDQMIRTYYRLLRLDNYKFEQ